MSMVMRLHQQQLKRVGVAVEQPRATEPRAHASIRNDTSNNTNTKTNTNTSTRFRYLVTLTVYHGNAGHGDAAEQALTSVKVSYEADRCVVARGLSNPCTCRSDDNTCPTPAPKPTPTAAPD